MEDRTMTKGARPPHETPLAIGEKDRTEIENLYARLQQSQAKLVGPNGESKNLPGSVYSFLIELLETLRQGNSVAIIQHSAKLTTVEAAHLLGVSRQFLVNLLEKGDMPYHMVGSHRRIYAKDVLAYRIKRDNTRRKAISDLSRAEAEEGLYDSAVDECSTP
jgi:excisionase family DNA binding protein